MRLFTVDTESNRRDFKVVPVSKRLLFFFLSAPGEVVFTLTGASRGKLARLGPSGSLRCCSRTGSHWDRSERWARTGLFLSMVIRWCTVGHLVVRAGSRGVRADPHIRPVLLLLWRGLSSVGAGGRCLQTSWPEKRQHAHGWLFRVSRKKEKDCVVTRLPRVEKVVQEVERTDFQPWNKLLICGGCAVFTGTLPFHVFYWS